MFHFSELEGMTFKELKRLAKEKNFSRRWTSKREIIDQIMGTGQDENLDMITVTLVDSPDSTKSSSGHGVYVEGVSCVPQQSTTEAVRTTRSAQSRFPKPRMTVFQQPEGDSSIAEAESSYKRNRKYFITPGRLRKSTANETFSYSTLEVASKAVSSRKKKSSTHNFTSTGTLAIDGVTFREQRRPVTRSYKNRVTGLDLLESTAECYPGFNSAENFGATSGDDENSSTTSSARITRKTRHRIARGTTDSLEKTNLDLGESFRGKKLNKSSSSDTAEMPATCSRERQFNISGGVKEAQDTEISSPKCNFNETFQIQNETTKSDMSFPLEDNIKEQDVQPDSLNDSSERKRITASPLRMQGQSKTSTPKDDAHDTDNEISDSGSVNATFEIPCSSDVSHDVSNMENNNRGRRRSSSCPHKGTNKKSHSKAVFFSPTTKLVKSPASCHPKRGTPLKGTKIPKFVKKMPDFTNIHKKEFEKMESLVDCHQRKLARAKTLFSPKVTKGVQSVMVFTAQSSATKQIPSRNPMTQVNVFPNNRVNRNIPQKADGERPHNGRLMQRQDVKEMVTKKLPFEKKRIAEREESRTAIRGVRLNRRFELQMAHRKLN